MAELKTRPNDGDVHAFLNSVEHDKRREDAFTIMELMQEITGEPPKMWGASIVGFGTYRQRYANGSETDWMAIGFSPRKANLTLYIMNGFDQYNDLTSRLGKFKTGKACLYITRLENVDMDVLRDLISHSVQYVKDHMDIRNQTED